MRKLFFTLFFIMYVFYGFSQNHENDSIKKKEHKFLLGITIAPNYSSRQYHYEKNSWTGFSYGAAANDYPSLGYSILLNGKITKRKFMFTIGAGLGIYTYKGMRTYNYDYSWHDVHYEYNHKLVGINTGYNILFGNKKLWSIGITADINYIYSLTQKVNIDFYDHGLLTQKVEFTNDFTNKQFVYWGGLEIGRTINATKWLIVTISLSGKYSSTIYGNEIKEHSSFTTTQPRRLMASLLNISFYPIFK